MTPLHATPQGRRRLRLMLQFGGVVALGVAIAVGAAVGTGAWAQEPTEAGGAVPEPQSLGQRDFDRSEVEEEVWNLWKDRKVLTARRKAEALVEAQPDSIVGQLVLGSAIREGDGQLPQAMKHIGRARELYETAYPDPLAPGAPQQLHREILFQAQMVAGELEQYEYRLKLLDYHDSLYSPDMVAEHGWPLMRLGRFEEAREYARKASGAVDPFQRSLGLNALCAIEGEAATRLRRYEACKNAFEDAKLRAEGDDPFAKPDEITSVTVHAYNAALAALAHAEVEEAEKMCLEGVTRLEFTAANPWLLLVRMYGAQGRMSEAVSSLREMQNWRRKQPPSMRDQIRAESEATFAEVLLIAGETDAGMRVIDRALAQPDRRGLSSIDSERTMGAHALLRHAMERTHIERKRERATWIGTRQAWGERMEGVGHRVHAFTDEQRIISVLADDQRLHDTFRLFVHGGIEPVPVWLIGDLVDILGPGVVEVTLQRIRQEERESPERLEVLDAYYDAIATDIARARGDERATLELGKKALDALPDHEALLRARMAALAGHAALTLGLRGEGMGLLAEAMQRDAGALRRLGLTLPAVLKVSATGEAAQRAEALLRRSPRLDLRSGGGNGDSFVVTLSGDGLSLETCLVAPDGVEIGCATVDPMTGEPISQNPAGPASAGVQAGEKGSVDDQENEEEQAPPSAHDYAAMTVAAFHDRAFAMPVGLSNVDLSSLDGTATLSSEAAREKMEGLLENLADPEKPEKPAKPLYRDAVPQPDR